MDCVDVASEDCVDDVLVDEACVCDDVCGSDC